MSDTVLESTKVAGDVAARDFPRRLARAYWQALNAPPARIARALKRPAADALTPTNPIGVPVTDMPLPSSAVPWPMRTANTWIRKGLSRPVESQMVFVAGEGVLTAGEVDSLVRSLCAGLRVHGVEKGDHIAVDASQRLETYLVTLAALLCGAVVVRLGDTVGPQALQAMVAAAPSKMIFSDRLEMIGAAAGAARQIPLDADGSGFAAFLAQCPDGTADPLHSNSDIAPDDPAFVGFTSGSTSEPKAMQTSHEAVYRSTEVAQRVFGFDETDIFCTATDFTALSAFRSLVTLPFASGGRVVIPDAGARENPLALALLCERYGVTRLTAVPGVLRTFNKAGARVGREELAAMRTVFSGSGVLDWATAETFRERFSIPVVDYYGGREFATAAYSDPNGPQTMSTGGGYLHGCLAIIVDERETPVGPGDTGEIVVHSDCMTLSDLASIRDSGPWAGWHFTGDLGRFLSDRRLEIVGRKKDIIKTPEGTLVSPAEIEGVIHALDWVEEASVFAWTDGQGIERVGAALTAGHAPPDAERAAKAAVQAALGPYKTPAHILILDDLPRVGRGKPDKMRLRKMLSETAKVTAP